MKKFISVLCALVLLASSACLGVSAADPVVTISLVADPVSVGDTSINANLVVTLPENATGYELGAFVLDVTYNSELMSVADKPSWEVKGSTMYSEEVTANPYRLIWASVKPGEQYKAGDTVAATLKFKLKSPAVEGNDYSLGLSVAENNPISSMASQDGSYSEIIYTEDQVALIGADLLLEKPAFQYGDANTDGDVNLSDVSSLLQHIAGWDGVNISTDAADVNVDGDVNLSDVSKLLQYIAGWEGVILGQK